MDESAPECESDYPDSGPFCPHWAEPSECNEVCNKCGIRCKDHDPENRHEFEDKE